MTALAPDQLAAWPVQPGAPMPVADTVLDAVRGGRIPGRPQPSQPVSPVPDRLTPRQRQVITRMLDGRTKAQIADELGISPNTVRHLARDAYKRLGVHNRLQAALALGVIGGSP